MHLFINSYLFIYQGIYILFITIFFFSERVDGGVYSFLTLLSRWHLHNNASYVTCHDSENYCNVNWQMYSPWQWTLETIILIAWGKYIFLICIQVDALHSTFFLQVYVIVRKHCHNVTVLSHWLRQNSFDWKKSTCIWGITL